MIQLKTPNLTVTGKAGWCLSVAQDVWGVPHWYDYALEAWNSSSAFNHPNEQPPSDVAVVVYWTYFDVVDQMPYGHIATFVPGRGVYTSPFNSLHGAEWYASIQAMTDRIRKIDKNSVYLGWSEVLSNVNLVGVDMIQDTDNEFARWQKLGWQVRGREMSRDEFRGGAVGHTWLTAIEILSDDSEADTAQNWQNVGKVAVTDNWEGQINTANQTIADLQLQLTGKQAEINDLQDDIATLKTENEALKKQVKDLEAQVAAGGTDVTINFNNFGVIAWTLIKSFGLKKG